MLFTCFLLTHFYRLELHTVMMLTSSRTHKRSYHFHLMNTHSKITHVCKSSSILKAIVCQWSTMLLKTPHLQKNKMKFLSGIARSRVQNKTKIMCKHQRTLQDVKKLGQPRENEKCYFQLGKR